MTKTQYSVDITTKGGYNVVADDAVVEGAGSAANIQIEQMQDIKFATATGFTVIPYHALDHAIVTVSIATVVDPVDPTCEP